MNTVTLDPGAVPAAIEPADPQPVRRRRPVVLVIEDDPHVRGLVRYILEAEDLLVLTASDGVAGLRKAAVAQPAVIVLDLMLPELSGYDVCAQLRAGARTDGPGILMLTARDRSLDIELGWAVGADDYLTKPFKRYGLVKRVNRLIPPDRR